MAPQTAAVFDTAFDALPNPKRVWVGEPGSREEGLGRLALLTPETVASAAASEIKTGQRFGLNWDMRKMEVANMNRHPCQHHILPIVNGVATDDMYIFNPQQSSQWDGLRHFSQPKTESADAKDPLAGGSGERVFYGGTTLSEIMDRLQDRIGMQHWARQGIAGRGVLVDYAAWAEKKGVKYSAFDGHHIALGDIHTIMDECNIKIRRGDILFVRIGLTKEYDEKMTFEDVRAYALSKHVKHSGVEATRDTLRFLWDNKISAVAGDSLSWESYPPKGDLFMHEWLLAGWGMPIGELFDLEALAEACKELNRWTFFVTSMPLNMVGGVSTPPNAMAIF